MFRAATQKESIKGETSRRCEDRVVEEAMNGRIASEEESSEMVEA